MARWRQGFLAASVLLLGCGQAGREPPSADTDLARLLPAPASLEGWSVAEGPIEYSPDSLWEYLDGAAPRYLAHGFRKLIHVRYQLGADSLASVSLDLFDMGGRLGAFGIYRSGLPPEAEPQQWGAEGHRSGTLAAAWKGRVYVHGEADDARPALVEMLERLLPGVCDRAAGDASLPSILGALPPDALVARSERYVAEDLLGHAFLPGGVLASYEMEGLRARLFFSDLGGTRAVTEALAELRAHHGEWGEVGDEEPPIGTGGFRFSHPALGSGTVVGQGRFVAGVHGDLAPAAQERLLARLLANLDSD